MFFNNIFIKLYLIQSVPILKVILCFSVCIYLVQFCIAFLFPDEKKLINSVPSVVNDALEGLLLSNPNVSKVDGFNILVRRDIEEYKQTHVTLISGGGSGHEPAHAGFVGDGMLSCAVCGNVFASPSVSSILTAIRLCAGPKGVLVIIKNYTGDRLNFGMAMEKAKLEGIKVKMVIVADDCALPIGKGITGGRGVAGTIFVHKLAGALAANPTSTLDEVHALAEKVILSVGSMGIALSVCCVPGAMPSNRLDDPALIEIGLGIHGEPGREQRSIPSTQAAEQLAEVMIDSILGASGRLQVDTNEDEVAVLLNNLGGLSILELSICMREVIANLKARGLHIYSVHVGSLMTSLNMNGVSLSLLKMPRNNHASDHMRSYLDAPTSCLAWVASYSMTELNSSSGVPDYLSTRSIKSTDSTGSATNIHPQLRLPDSIVKQVSAVCNTLIGNEPKLTEYDTMCGDGDCGLSLSAGARYILNHLEPVPAAAHELHWDEIFATLADCVSRSMGGTLGAVIEIFFRAIAVSLAELSPQDPDGWLSALEKGVEAIRFYGGAAPGMRTMLDALIPAVEAIRSAPGSTSAASFQVSATAAHDGAEATRTMTALAGRANYVSEEVTRGVPDPGAMAVALVFTALAQSSE